MTIRPALMESVKCIELRYFDYPPRRRIIDRDIARVIMPIRVPGAPGFGELEFRPSGLYADDGIEIWLPGVDR